MTEETAVTGAETQPVQMAPGRRPGDGTAVVTVVYFSRYRGATEALAAAVASGAASVPGVTVHRISTDEVDRHWALLHRSDALVFGSPTYVGGVAARFKDFIESCAGDVWVRRLWLNKLAGGFTVSSGRSGDKLHCLMDLLVFAMQMGMIWSGSPSPAATTRPGAARLTSTGWPATSASWPKPTSMSRRAWHHRPATWRQRRSTGSTWRGTPARWCSAAHSSRAGANPALRPTEPRRRCSTACPKQCQVNASRVTAKTPQTSPSGVSRH